MKCVRLHELQRLSQARYLHHLRPLRKQTPPSNNSLTYDRPRKRNASVSIAPAAAAAAKASRTAATSQAAATAAEAGSIVTGIKNLLLGTSVGLFLWLGYLYVTDVRAGIHQWAVAPSLRWFYDDAEEAHEAGTEWLKGLYAWGLHPRERGGLDSKGDLSIEVRTGPNTPAAEFVEGNGSINAGLRSHPLESHWHISRHRQACIHSRPSLRPWSQHNRDWWLYSVSPRW